MNGERTRGARLDLHLRHLEREERNIGEELDQCGLSAYTWETPPPGESHVLVLEDLSGTVHEGILESSRRRFPWATMVLKGQYPCTWPH